MNQRLQYLTCTITDAPGEKQIIQRDQINLNPRLRTTNLFAKPVFNFALHK